MEQTVQVLLSSYNGEKYIREQIDSILGQKDIRIQLLVRDDGSIDGTRDILAEYEKSHDNIRVLYGKNLGVIRSFFALIEAADEQYPYIAFSDQDDVWLPDKLARAVRMLEKERKRQETAGKGMIPFAYCSAKQLVNADLHPLKQAICYPAVRAEFGNALVENMCTGCTCVVDKTFLSLLKGKEPRFTVMHDFWFYLVGTCFGKVIYDRESRILYRQHGGNELGAASSLFENYRRRVKYYRKHRGQLTRQAEEFLRIYGDKMPKGKRKLAEALVRSRTDRKIRKKLLKERRIFRQRRSDDLIFRVLLAAGKL